MPAKQLMDRRRALKSTLFWAGASVLPCTASRASGFIAANDRPRVAAVGTGSRWYIKATGIDKSYGSAPSFRKFGDYVAVCDADAERKARAAEIVKEWSGTKPASADDYRAIIDRDDIDIVHISTPDHWHAKLAIESMLSGKDVYCEKPMTLTIEEGQRICEVAKRTGRVVQIGTQQRSNSNFIRANALIRDGRIGDLQSAEVGIGGSPTSPELPVAEPPKHLDWNQWQGPVPEAPFHYLAGDYGETKSWSRCHYEFRWWYEYSGGKLTDWGAHHVDIATWAFDKTDTGPTSVRPMMVKHPVPFEDGFPTVRNRYNTATEFEILAAYDDGLEMTIRHSGDNGILFTGTKGRIFVNRGRLTGKPVEELAENPLPAGALEAVYKGRPLTDHFRNFFEASTDRREPISDVFSHHRALSTCHLAGIAARLGRELKWDPVQERIIDDVQAQQFVRRDSREGFAIQV